MKMRWKLCFFSVICVVDALLFAGLVRAAAVYGSVHVWSEQAQGDGDGAWRAEGQEGKCVALTFDDGPDDEYTKQLLDGLKERGVHATFFLMGQNISGNEELVRRMQQEGHLIGNHSYSHLQLSKVGADKVCQGVEKTSEIIKDITGVSPQYVRPPYGDWSEELECRVEMTAVLWSVDSLDWKLQNRGQIVKRVLKETENGDIILMHDIFPTSVTAALDIVDALTAEGYTFVTVNELVID